MANSTAKFIVLMGMQGAGKGTQAEILQEHLHIPHITSGGMFRATMQQDTPLAHEIKSYYDAGNLVPDTLTIRMIKGRLQESDAENGVILDGFPRTVAQAKALDELMIELGQKIAVVPFFVITEAEAMKRLGGRRVCTKDDNHVYHITDNPPNVNGICDIDGAPLKIRSDDTPDAIQKRLKAYANDTTPVLDYYREAGLLQEVNAEQPIEKVTADLKAVVEGQTA